MTKDEALKLALEALIAAKTNHGVMLMSDPPQEAWKFNQVDLKIFRAEEALRQALEQPSDIEAAVRAENEACAKVCESIRPSEQEFDQRFYTACTLCANAIRARGE